MHGREAALGLGAINAALQPLCPERTASGPIGLTEIHRLPAPETEPPAAHRQQQVRPEKGCPHVGIAVPFRMGKGGRAGSFGKLGNKTLKESQHITPDIGIRSLIDGQTAGRVRTEQQQRTVTTLLLLRPARHKGTHFRRNVTEFTARPRGKGKRKHSSPLCAGEVRSRPHPDPAVTASGMHVTGNVRGRGKKSAQAPAPAPPHVHRSVPDPCASRPIPRQERGNRPPVPAAYPHRRCVVGPRA